MRSPFLPSPPPFPEKLCLLRSHNRNCNRFSKKSALEKCKELTKLFIRLLPIVGCHKRPAIGAWWAQEKLRGQQRSSGGGDAYSKLFLNWQMGMGTGAGAARCGQSALPSATAQRPAGGIASTKRRSAPRSLAGSGRNRDD